MRHRGRKDSNHDDRAIEMMNIIASATAIHYVGCSRADEVSEGGVENK